MNHFKSIVLALSVIFLFAACSTKQKEQEYNKPALYWYNKMIKLISQNNVEDADDAYISLESEHKNSPLVPSALMIIANAHIDEEEYEMANFYLDEYLKKFAFSKNIDHIRYLKIKAKFLAFKSQFREQQLLQDTIEEVEEFLTAFPNSSYRYLIQDMRSRLYMAKASFDKEIADLYARIDKPKASEFYTAKVKKSWVDPNEIEPVNVPWYRWLFE